MRASILLFFIIYANSDKLVQNPVDITFYAAKITSNVPVFITWNIGMLTNRTYDQAFEYQKNWFRSYVSSILYGSTKKITTIDVPSHINLDVALSIANELNILGLYSFTNGEHLFVKVPLPKI